MNFVHNDRYGLFMVIYKPSKLIYISVHIDRVYHFIHLSTGGAKRECQARVTPLNRHLKVSDSGPIEKPEGLKVSVVTEGDLDFGVSVWDRYYRVCPKSQLLKTNPYAHAYLTKYQIFMPYLHQSFNPSNGFHLLLRW